MSGEDKQIMSLMNATNERIAEMLAEENEDKEEINLKEDYVEIDDERVVFVEKELIPDGLKMYVPNYFEKIPENIAKLKYPNENRPEYIYSNPDYSINITFKCFNIQVSSAELPQIRDSFKNTMQMMNKTSECLGEDVIEAQTYTIPYFETKTAAFDCELYNLIFLVIVQQKLVAGTFNCMSGDKEDWEKVAKAMIKTIL